MKNKVPLIALIVNILVTGSLAAQERPAVAPDTLSHWCHYLAGDEMKGRRNGSPEMKLAADYIAGVFRNSGLRPVERLGGYFQEYSLQTRNNVTIRERNVVGMIEGSDPELKNEWIVLSAHFDHVGIGRPVKDDSIYNGALDNAAGTVTLMALAKLLGSQPEKLQRSVLFVAFSGEEIGMRGSRHFVANSPVPLEQIRLNLNFEMTGEFKSLGDKLFILTGFRFTDFDELVKAYSQGKEWQMAEVMKSAEWVFLSSDNASFAVNRSGGEMSLGIPAFTIVTADDMTLIHKPSDEPQFIDYENMASLVDYLEGLIVFLSGDPLEVSWDEEAFRKAFAR
ncbi:MAG: M28 family peptidase [Bacteroidales bacterium]